jgi:flagellar basal-body rod protein FlgG
MLRSLFTSATGLAAQQMNLDIIANNLANASTNGFKASRADFEDLIYQTIRQPGAQTGTNSQLPTGTQIGLGVSAGTTTPLMTQGTIQNTGGIYDLAITGAGYFKVLLPDGSNGYTRAGNLSIDSTGKIVTAEGYPIQPEIIIPPTAGQAVSISADGQVSVQLPSQSAPQTVGQIQLTNFSNPAGLHAIGGNVFQQTSASGAPTDGNPGAQGLGTIQQQAVESSNVNVVDEMIRMIIVQRAYDTNSKVIQTADQMLNTTNNIKQ